MTRVEPDDASHKTTDVDSFGVMTPCQHFGVVIPRKTGNGNILAFTASRHGLWQTKL